MAEEIDKSTKHNCQKTEIICGICQEKSCHPKLLSCYHAYCRTCLQRYIDINCEHGNVRCPMCRSLIEINSDGALIGVTDLLVKMISEEVIMCEVCETSQAVNFCLECAQSYCQTCADMHAKIKLTREHHIVPNGKILLQNKKRSTSFCTKHESEPLHYFCNDCNVPICFKCNMTEHKTHGCEDITSVAESKRKYLQQELLGQVTCRVMILEERLQKCEYKRQYIEDECKKETEMIRDHAIMLKARIDEQMKALVNKLQENVEKYFQVIQNQEGVIENELRALKAKSCYIQQCVDFAGDAELINILPGLEHGPVMKDASIWLEENANIEYSPRNVSDDEIKMMIGVPSVRLVLASPIQIEKMLEFKFDETIQGICGISPDTVWIAYGECIQKFTKHQGPCDKVDIREEVYDVAMDIDGKIYVACKSAVREVNADLSVVKCFGLSFCPSGITISEDGKICVCFKGSGRISVYSKEGKACLELHKDSCHGMPVAPLKAAIYNQQIYVTDLSSQNEDVTVMSLEGEIRNKFKHSNMDPRGLAISRQGYVFVTDKRNKCIHIFNQQGIYLSTLNSNMDYVTACIVSQTDLWIGDYVGKVRVLRLSCKTKSHVTIHSGSFQIEHHVCFDDIQVINHKTKHGIKSYTSMRHLLCFILPTE
ncbi:hypothetical protein CHS0354_008797 [Potamilus streckersoni]|uniref:Uncharacterized protein n=1 Tax=Potamilus streckersoni TaxID=2493646 RepID=A0AAE0SNK8_9BIVA|nr:hypothetical protein CHS0354_008797 [Potamilus streckersoni]